MKFLCLHGNGTNSNVSFIQISPSGHSLQLVRVMKLQTAPLRHELQDGHSYEFVEATQKVPFSVGLESFASPDDEFFSFYDEADFSSLPTVLDQLDKYIASQGPFDAVMGFSAGAVMAALHLLQLQRKGEPLPFRCAVFLSAGASTPALESLGIDVKLKDRIQIPSVHIWGSADDWAPTAGRDLSRLFEPGRRLNLIHDGGHEVPRKAFVNESVHVIRRIVALADES